MCDQTYSSVELATDLLKLVSAEDPENSAWECLDICDELYQYYRRHACGTNAEKDLSEGLMAFYANDDVENAFQKSFEGCVDQTEPLKVKAHRVEWLGVMASAAPSANMILSLLKRLLTSFAAKFNNDKFLLAKSCLDFLISAQVESLRIVFRKSFAAKQRDDFIKSDYLALAKEFCARVGLTASPVQEAYSIA